MSNLHCSRSLLILKESWILSTVARFPICLKQTETRFVDRCQKSKSRIHADVFRFSSAGEAGSATEISVKQNAMSRVKTYSFLKTTKTIPTIRKLISTLQTRLHLQHESRIN